MKSDTQAPGWTPEEARDIWASAMRKISALRPSPAALAVFVQIMDLRLETAPETYLTQVPELARRTGFSEDAVSDAIAWLKGKDLILVARDHRTGRISSAIKFNGFNIIPWFCHKVPVLGKTWGQISPFRRTPATSPGSNIYQDTSTWTDKGRASKQAQRPSETISEWARRGEERCRKSLDLFKRFGKQRKGHQFATAGTIFKTLGPPAPA